MARETNAMITLDDAKYMVANEGFIELNPIPSGNDILDRADIENYINANPNNFSAYENTRLVPYHLLEPTVLACNESFNGSNGTFAYTIEFGAGIGWIGVDCNAYGIPDAFTFEWNGKSITSGWIGDTYTSLPARHENNTANPDNGNVKLYLYKDSASPSSATIYIDGEAGVGGTAWDVSGICDRPTAWREIDQYCVKENRELILKTSSTSSQWFLHRFRIVGYDSNTTVEAYYNGNLLDSKPFHSTVTGSEHNFVLDLSGNGGEAEIYIKDLPSSAKVQQLYAVPQYTGRYGSGTIQNALLTYIDMEILKFDDGYPTSTITYVFAQNQPLNTIVGANHFYGYYLKVANCGLSTFIVDDILNGCDNLGRTGGVLDLSGNGARSNDIAYNNLLNKGWTITI